MVINNNTKFIHLIQNSSSLKWETSVLPKSEILQNWVPICCLLEDDIFLGVSQAGYWVQQIGEYIIPINHSEYLRDLLPCLKKKKSEIQQLMEQGLEKQLLSIEIGDLFPFKTLILSGMRSQSNYWLNLALNWLEDELNYEFNNNEVREILNSKWASQKNKQRLRKIIKAQ